MNNGEINRASPKTLAVAERRRFALEYRKAGGSYRQIAEKMRERPDVSDRYSEAQAHRDVTAELDRLVGMNTQAAEQLRELQADQLRELWQKYYPAAQKGDSIAFGVCMSILDRQGRLYGLNSLNVALTGKDGGPLALEHSGKGGGSIVVEHAIDGDTAGTIFDILAAIGALPTGADGAAPDPLHPAQADAQAGGVSAAAPS